MEGHWPCQSRTVENLRTGLRAKNSTTCGAAWRSLALGDLDQMEAEGGFNRPVHDAHLPVHQLDQCSGGAQSAVWESPRNLR